MVALFLANDKLDAHPTSCSVEIPVAFFTSEDFISAYWRRCLSDTVLYLQVSLPAAPPTSVRPVINGIAFQARDTNNAISPRTSSPVTNCGVFQTTDATTPLHRGLRPRLLTVLPFRQEIPTTPLHRGLRPRLLTVVSFRHRQLSVTLPPAPPSSVPTGYLNTALQAELLNNSTIKQLNNKNNSTIFVSLQIYFKIV